MAEVKDNDGRKSADRDAKSKADKSGKSGGSKGAGGGGGGKTDPNSRDDGTRAPVGTGGGAHSPRGNQAGKDAQGREIGDKNNPNAAVHTNAMGISVQRSPQAQKNLEKAANEFADQSLVEGFFDFVGFGQVDPATDPEFNAATMDTPNLDVDVLGLGVGLAGLIGGVPLAGQIPEALRQVGVLPDDFGKVTMPDPTAPTAPTGYGSLPDGTTVDGPVDTDPAGGSSGGGNSGGDRAGGSGGAVGQGVKPVKKPTTATDITEDTTSGGLPTVQPAEGLGIDVLTQTGGSNTDVNIRTPEQRRRRGSLGGLGLGGIGI